LRRAATPAQRRGSWPALRRGAVECRDRAQPACGATPASPVRIVDGARERMKIAVLGGGTAGFIAASHFTRHLPDAELLHVFDSSIPTIGVGEGTTPRFPGWFEEVTGLGFPVLAARCGATLKTGTRFEDWGS